MCGDRVRRRAELVGPHRNAPSRVCPLHGVRLLSSAGTPLPWPRRFRVLPTHLMRMWRPLGARSAVTRTAQMWLWEWSGESL